MANNPQTSKERTEQEVLSAIEEALNLRDLDQGPKQRSGTSTSAGPGSITSATPLAPPASPGAGSSVSSNAQRTQRLPRIDEAILDAPATAPGGEDRVRRAANDDRENIGQLLRALQQRPAGRHHLYAWAFTGVWIVVVLGLVVGTFGSEIRDA